MREVGRGIASSALSGRSNELLGKEGLARFGNGGAFRSEPFPCRADARFRVFRG